VVCKIFKKFHSHWNLCYPSAKSEEKAMGDKGKKDKRKKEAKKPKKDTQKADKKDKPSNK